MKNIGRKLWRWLLAIALMSLVAYIGNGTPLRIQQNLSSVEVSFSDEPELLASREIIIDGWVKRDVWNFESGRWGEWMYEGVFTIEGIPKTFACDAEVRLSGGGILGYPYFYDPEMPSEGTKVGLFLAHRTMDWIVINITEWTHYDDGNATGSLGDRLIVAPATTIGEAIAIVRAHKIPGFEYV